MATASDDFNRANETPLAGNWTRSAAAADAASWNLATNSVTPNDLTQDGSAFYNAISFGNDQLSRAALTVNSTTGGGTGAGLCVRRSTTAATCTYYRVCVDHGAANNVTLGRWLTAVFSSLATTTVASWTNGDIWELRAVGPQAATVLTVYRNGTQVLTFTDNSTVASGSPGIAYSSTATSASIDNWTGTDTFGGAVRTFNAIPFMGGH